MVNTMEPYIQNEVEKMINCCDEEFKGEYHEFMEIIEDIKKNGSATTLQLCELENMYNFKSPLIEFVFKCAFNLGYNARCSS